MPVSSNKAHVIVVGNEKGGSGKSTTAMHLVVALLRMGKNLASIDLDLRQSTLSRYLENRAAHALTNEVDLPMPDHYRLWNGSGGEDELKQLSDLMSWLVENRGIIVIDTPAGASDLCRLGHSYADTLVTPMNDSFIDLDVLSRVDREKIAIDGAGHYAQMVWEEKINRAKRDRGSIDWLVMRNRLTNLDAINKRHMERLLADLALRIGFRHVSGFGERVIFREMFHNGLTLMDLVEDKEDKDITLSQVAARQEVRALVKSLRLT
jgi:chromosome partitioning protein